MNLHISHIPKLIAQWRASAILGMIIIAMLWGGVVISYVEGVKQDYRDAQTTNLNYAMLFEENVLRSIGEIDKALLYLRRSVEGRRTTTDYLSIVRSADILSEIIVQVAIIDAKGISQGSNAAGQPSGVIDISDREHFRVHLNSDEDKLFISKPVIGRASGKWSVQFTRRFSDNEGKFAGIVVASMDPAHFASFYDKINLGPTTSVALIGHDGVVRSSGGGTGGPLSLGQNISDSKLFGRIQAGVTALFDDEEPAAADSHFVTARAVRGYPLWVTISSKTKDIYSPSKAALQQNIAIVAVLTLLTLIALEQILRSEAQAKQKAEQLQLTLEHISQGIMLVTPDHQIPIINRRCGELLKLPGEMINTPPSTDRLAEYQIQNGETHPIATEPPIHNDASHAAGEPTITDYRRSDGAYIEVRKTGLPDGGFVQTFTDITKRREAEAEIVRLASEDPLTQLPNRRIFYAVLEEQCRRRAHPPDDSGQAACAVLFLDVDRFKVVNDTLGHRVGDLLLIAIARRLKAVLRKDDVLARFGGDEFAILLPAVESVTEIEDQANKIIEAMDQSFRIDHHLIRSSISIGIAIGPRDATTADDLLMASDLALYAVKMGGRGIYRFYERSMNEELNERRQTELDLREALERGQLELFYQPVIDLRRNLVVGFEALARWLHPTKGIIEPTKFIPVAEDCGLIMPLGEWALREACRMAAQWPDDLAIAVNLSPVQLTSSDILGKVVNILSETGLAPSRLTLEITERVFLEDSEKTLLTLHELKKLGIQIALDDFGTGYSSLRYLRSFPFDTIKVDRAFVADLGEDIGSSIIVQGVILIAGGLGIRTIAEGVVTSFQQEMLKTLGCDQVQGHLFSPAVPIAQVPALIDAWAAKTETDTKKKTVAA